MPMWSQLLMQESNSLVMQLLSLFHDYALAVMMMILIFVTGVSIFMITNKMISDSPIMTMVEVIWTVMPMVILAFMAIPSLQILYFSEENDPFLTLKIMGHQWYWSYEVLDIDMEFDSYMIPDSMIGEPRLLEVDHRVVLPTNKDIQGLITAADVLHSWTLPSVGVKADAVPGRLNQVAMNIMRPSIIYGQCSEICGANHSFMPITVEAINNKTFLEWVNQL